MANEETPLVISFKVIIHSYGDFDCHILIVLSSLPLTIFEFGNMANELIQSVCPCKVAIN